MPIVRNCAVCKKEFKTKPFFIKNGGGKYCSSACQYVGMKKGKMVICDTCGKETYKTPKALRISKSKKFFCSKSCQTTWRNREFIGPKHANFKTDRASYQSVLPRNNVPKICRLCQTIDARVLAVHHLDQNRNNNDISNLVWLCHNCHHLVHRYKGEKEKLMEVLV